MIAKQQASKPVSKWRWIAYVPIIILLGIIPLIVRLARTEIVDERILYLTNHNNDLFSQTKATWIMVMVGVMVLLAFFAYSKEYIKWDSFSKVYYGSTAAYIVMTVLSMFMSEYDFVAKWGLPNRAEGGVMLICYMVIMLYTYSVVTHAVDYKYLLIPLGILVFVQLVLGYFQYIGEDLLMTEWGKQIIIPEYYAEDRERLQPLYEGGNMYGTMFHYNYIGSFTAMMLPMFAVLTVFLKDYKWKLFSGIVTVLSLLLLLGSTARSGLIGVACSVVVAILIFSRYFIKRWKISLGLIAGVGVIIIGLNAATNGAIFARIPTLTADIAAMFTTQEDTPDYKESLPLRDVQHEGGKATLHMGDKTLTIETVDGVLHFYDETGQQVVYFQMNYDAQEQRYITQDTRYADWQLVVVDIEGIPYAKLIYKNTYVATFTTQEEVHLVEHFTQQAMELTEPESWGFEGKEKLGSARGYIWSRSLPLLKETWLVGTGPDTFGFEFPQEDLLGKWYAYGDPNMVVDKAHNLYLQIAIQQGGVALVAFLVLVGTYLVQCIKLYGFKKDYDEQQIIGMALMIAVVGYLGAGIFNDSVVSVAPIFWILLGAGMAMNYLYKELLVKQRKQQAHAVVDIKSKKHI